MKILKSIYRELMIIKSHIIINFPGRTGELLRKLYWRNILKLEGDFFIGKGTEITNAELFRVGTNFVLGDNIVLNAANSQGVYIGDYVGIARNCYLRAANHKFDKIDIPWMKQGHECSEINYLNNIYSVIIEDDVWIGANVTILSGTHLSKGSIVSAGSVVSGFVKPYSVVMGNPARVIKSRAKAKDD